jgi:multidrug transporter EmrE-like cation transporter
MIGYRDFHMTKPRAYVTLGLTVVCEVTATLCVKASDGLTEVLPSAGAVTGFVLTTLLLAKVVEVIPTSIAYTIWTGTGAVAVSVLGVALFGDHLTRLAWVGIGLVVLGVGTLNLQPSRQEAGHRAEGA